MGCRNIRLLPRTGCVDYTGWPKKKKNTETNQNDTDTKLYFWYKLYTM